MEKMFPSAIPGKRPPPWISAKSLPAGGFAGIRWGVGGLCGASLPHFRAYIDWTENHAQEDSEDDTEPCETGLAEEDDVVLEPWADFVRRVTHSIEAQMCTVCSEDWVTTHRKKK